jgi:hypothetical protein
MGQYWKPVNLDKREFINPHKLGCGLKLWEQLANHPGTGTALLILQAAMPEGRGGGDLEEDEVIGRWAGDRVVLIGDYAEDSDLKNSPVKASKIYKLCWSPEYGGKKPRGAFLDISDLVAPVIERELGGKYTGDGWRHFKYDDDERETGVSMKPDVLLVGGR